MYLILGSEAAALVDSGCGSGDSLPAFLAAALPALAALPLLLLNTHTHYDHVAANAAFQAPDSPIKVRPWDLSLTELAEPWALFRRRCA